MGENISSGYYPKTARDRHVDTILDTNMKSYVGSPTAPLDLTLSDIKRSM